jgi:hypothetical protein
MSKQKEQELEARKADAASKIAYGKACNETINKMKLVPLVGTQKRLKVVTTSAGQKPTI